MTLVISNSNNTHSANHFHLAQAGIMNINERKHLSARAQALVSQTTSGQPFWPFMNGFCRKICISKHLLVRFKDIALR